MRPNAITRPMFSTLALAGLLAGAVLAIAAAPASAQLVGPLRYVWGYVLTPNPPLASGPTTMQLFGVYPTGCGVIEEESVVDPGHVTLRLRSTVCTDTTTGSWVATFPLGMLPGGNHSVTITLSMDRPDSGVTVYEGSLTFFVEDSTSSPPPPSPPPPPPGPPPPAPLVTQTTTDPWPATPSRPMAFIVGGYAPFTCPIVTAATVVDTSHLAITLSPGSCADTAGFWSHRFELGEQREGHHFLDLAITLDGDSLVTRHVPVGFLVVNDSTGWGPPPIDSLQNMMSPSRPNPFLSDSRFSVSIDDAADANVAVYDVLGRRVRQVFNGRLPAGTTELMWNGRRDDGVRATAGVYFYRLEMRGRVISRRLVLLPQ